MLLLAPEDRRRHVGTCRLAKHLHIWLNRSRRTLRHRRLSECVWLLDTGGCIPLAFSTVNDALAAQPDAELLRAAPPEVRSAVTYGRPADAK